MMEMKGKFSEVEYRRPDMEAIARDIQVYIDALGRAESYEEARQLLFRHMKAMEEYTTLQYIVFVRNTTDTTDPFYDGEMAFFHKETPKLSLLRRKANTALLASPYRPRFEEEFGAQFFRNMEVQILFADERIVDDLFQQSRLSQRYAKVTASATTEFAGQTCNFYALLKHMQSTNRSVRRSAYQAWADLYKSIAPQLDEIYDQLVQLRDGMARKMGFPSFVEMCYLQRNRYDYTPQDVAHFRRQVKEIITPACTKLAQQQAQRLGIEKLCYYDEALVFPEGNPVPQGDRSALVEAAQKMYRAMSPETGAYFDQLVEHDLFELDSKPGKRGGGYCITFPALGLPLIFANFNGTSADVDVLTHEAGHGFESYLSNHVLPFYEMALATSEVLEIHSMSMEHFAYPWMPLFFGENADKYCYAHLYKSLRAIPYMCVVDEYQHKVFENPAMSATERHAVWRSLEKEYLPWRDYDGNTFMEEGYLWMNQQHIFMMPFYYIDYALAQICAFQFHTKDKKDHASAWTDYLRLCRAGGSKGYFEVLEYAGLHNPLKGDTVKDTVRGILEELNL